MEIGGTTIHLAPANFSGVVLDIPTGQKNEYVNAKDQNNKNLSDACLKCTLYNRGVKGMGKLGEFLQGRSLSSVTERDLDEAKLVVEELRGFIWRRRPEMRAALTKMQRPELKKLAVSVSGLEVVVEDVPNDPVQMLDLGGIEISTTEAISVVVDGALIPSSKDEWAKLLEVGGKMFGYQPPVSPNSFLVLVLLYLLRISSVPPRAALCCF